MVSTVSELTAAVVDASVPHIVIAPGTYRFTSNMCSNENRDEKTEYSALCIGRDVTIEAAVADTVVLDAGTYYVHDTRRVIYISGGAAKLINLVITGGHAVRGSASPRLGRARHAPMMPVAYAAHD